MKHLFILFLFAFIWIHGECQNYINPPGDTTNGLYAGNYIGIKLFAADYNVHALNQDLQFTYTSQNNGYVMKHDMNLKGLTVMPNIGLGVEETMGKHLFINFANLTFGYAQHAKDWSGGVGLGYSTPLNKKENLVVRAYLNAFYENITYGLGTYSDSTLLGFEINGVNIGAYVKNIKYTNSIICLNPAIDLVYRGKNFDYFLSAGYNYNLFHKEKLDFYKTHITIGSGLYDESGNPVSKDAIVPGNYIIQLGIIREFGL